jgi:hypothetical protein
MLAYTHARIGYKISLQYIYFGLFMPNCKNHNSDLFFTPVSTLPYTVRHNRVTYHLVQRTFQSPVAVIYYVPTAPPRNHLQICDQDFASTPGKDDNGSACGQGYMVEWYKVLLSWNCTMWTYLWPTLLWECACVCLWARACVCQQQTSAHCSQSTVCAFPSTCIKLVLETVDTFQTLCHGSTAVRIH